MGSDVRTVDEALELTGGFGRFQWHLVAMMAYCMTTLGLQGLTMTFTANEPGWKCKSNTSVCNVTGFQKAGMKSYKVRCDLADHEWMYDDSFTSIVTQYNLYCDRSILKNIATSMVYLGWFLGAIIYGVVSDKYGRKKALLISTTVMATAGVLSAFPKVFWLFVVIKVFVGSGIGGSMMCIFILNTEFAGPKKRSFAGIVVWNFWVVGLSLVALLAYLIRDWRYFTIATSAPGLLVPLLYWYLPESIRWLMVHGRREEAETILKNVARTNHVTYPVGLFLKGIDPDEQKSGNIMEIFKEFKLAIYTLCCMFIWFTCSMTYYGVSLSTGHLGGNIYFVFFLTTIVAVPANFLATYLIDRFGRKKIMIITLALAAISMICAALFPAKNKEEGFMIGRIFMAMAAKFLITIAFDAAYMITYEIFPTTLRNLGMGISSATARVGSFSASYVTYLIEIERILPFVIFGGIAITCSLVSCILPETNNTPTKETLSKNDYKPQVEMKTLD